MCTTTTTTIPVVFFFFFFVFLTSIILNSNNGECRSSRDILQGQGRKPTNGQSEPVQISPILPPPPSSKNPVPSEVGMVDYLSGDTYESGRSSGTLRSVPVPVSDSTHSKNKNSLPPSNPPPPQFSSSPPPDDDDFVNPTAALFSSKPANDKPTPLSKSAENLPVAPWEVSPPAANLPPPPSKYNQRQQFFEQIQGSNSNVGSSKSSYDGLVGQTQNLSIRSPNQAEKGKPDDALFKDLVDFAKSKTSSPKPNRSY